MRIVFRFLLVLAMLLTGAVALAPAASASDCFRLAPVSVTWSPQTVTDSWTGGGTTQVSSGCVSTALTIRFLVGGTPTATCVPFSVGSASSCDFAAGFSTSGSTLTGQYLFTALDRAGRAVRNQGTCSVTWGSAPSLVFGGWGAGCSAA